MTLFWTSKRACQVLDPFSKEGGPSAETDKKALKNDSFLSYFDAKKAFYGYFMGVGPFLKIGAGWLRESESAQKPLFLMLKRYYGDL